MRTTQYLGLADQAKQWLKENCKEQAIPTAHYVEGMFGEEVSELQKYSLKEPKTITELKKSPAYLETHVEEYIQAEPWSSGPVIFIALRYSKCKTPVQESLWSEETINNC